MHKETITYTDYNGVDRTEDFYFSMSKPEILRMQTSLRGGYDTQLRSIAADAEGNAKAILEFFEDFIFRSYGEKSDDGRRFLKSDDISRGFMETPAYEVLFTKLVTDDSAASNFVNAVLGEKTNSPTLVTNTVTNA